jgi:hypothetical protein
MKRIGDGHQPIACCLSALIRVAALVARDARHGGRFDLLVVTAWDRANGAGQAEQVPSAWARVWAGRTYGGRA